MFMVIYHTESIFNTNERQTWMWGEDDRPAKLPKTEASGIMVSDFVEEYGGSLKLTQEEFEHAKVWKPDTVPAARRLLEYGADQEGYEIASWSRSKMQQTLLNLNMMLLPTHFPGCLTSPVVTVNTTNTPFLLRTS